MKRQTLRQHPSNGAFAVETLEVRRVLSTAATVESLVAVASLADTTGAGDARVVDQTIQDPCNITGCWGGFAATDTRALVRFCIEVDEVCGDGEFKAMITLESGGLFAGAEATADGRIDQFTGGFALAWTGGRLFSGSVVGTVNSDTGEMQVTADYTWMCRSFSSTFTLLREDEPAPEPPVARPAPPTPPGPTVFSNSLLTLLNSD